MSGMLINTGITTTTYNSILSGWGDSSKIIQNNVVLNITQSYLSTVTAALNGRLWLTNTKGWNIIDHGNERSMIITWARHTNDGFHDINDTTDTEIRNILLSDSNTNDIIEINWGNNTNYVYNRFNNIVPINSVPYPILPGTVPYTIYISKRNPLAGNPILFSHSAYSISITPSISRFATGLRSVVRWGSDIRLATGGGHLRNAVNLESIPTDVPLPPTDNSLVSTFRNCVKFNGNNLGSWAAISASITNMSLTFSVMGSVFTYDLRGWNFNNVTTMNDFMNGTNYGTANYSNLLIHLNNNTTRTNVILRVDSTYFNQASVVSARNGLLSRGWIITDTGAV